MDIAAELSEHRGFPMLYLSGEIDVAAEQLLADRLGQLVDGHRCAILHVNDLTYADANALSMLLRTKQTFNSRGGMLAFVCCDAQVLRVLRTLGMLSNIDTFDDIDEVAAYLTAHCD